MKRRRCFRLEEALATDQRGPTGLDRRGLLDRRLADLSRGMCRVGSTTPREYV
jgi:hypothetical protein